LEHQKVGPKISEFRKEEDYIVVLPTEEADLPEDLRTRLLFYYIDYLKIRYDLFKH
jgi:hypothetical protein